MTLPYYVRVHTISGEVIASWKLKAGERPEDAEIFKSIYHPLSDAESVKTERGSTRRLSTAVDLQKALENAAGSKNRTPAGNLVPVYYLELTSKKTGEKRHYLSGSSAGRVAQARKWEKILGQDNAGGDHSPCRKLSRLCPACALFGTVEAEESAENSGDGKIKGIRGRLRFTDAAVIPESDGLPKAVPHDLQILANPKPSAYEFYQGQPRAGNGTRAVYWNFDCRIRSRRTRCATLWKTPERFPHRYRRF